MRLATLLADLAQRKALIVHFSHLSNMREGGAFPDDLKAAITNKDRWALSCSVVWPGHQMDLVGEVGVILKPTSVDQVLSVSNTDSGAWQSDSGEDLSGGIAPTPQSLADSFNVGRNDYNEWRVKGAEAVGIFVVRAKDVCAKAKRTIGVGGPCESEIIGPSLFSIAEVRAAFPSLPLITMTDGGPTAV